MKKFSFLLLLFLLLTGCTASENAIPVQILADELGEEIAGYMDMAQASEDYIRYCMSSDLSLYSEHIVLYPFAGTKYNEFGIFKLQDKNDLKQGIAEVEGYLSFKKENWDTRYMSEEFSKIKNAKVVSKDGYILYSILNEKEQEAIIKKFKNILK